MTTPDEQSQQLYDSVMNPSVFDIAVIGGGVAGLTAGLYASRDGFTTLVLEGTLESIVDAPGGALLQTSEIANYPGFASAEGAELVGLIRSQTEAFGAIIKEERVSDIEINTKKGCCHGITTTDGNTYRARVIIIATGAIARRLGVPGENALYGKGVSSCATCDGWFFQKKTVAVVGGGDTAIEDALLLTHYASHVHLMVRGDTLRATGPEAREILNHPDVTIHWNTTVEEVIADETGEELKSVILNAAGVKAELPLDGLFVAIGSDPATSFLEGTGIPLEADGYIPVDGASTAVLGIDTGTFAAGDVADRIYRQAITSAGKAAQAALEARAYLSASRHQENETESNC